MNCTCVLRGQGCPEATLALGVKLDFMTGLCVHEAGLSFHQTSLSEGIQRTTNPLQVSSARVELSQWPLLLQALCEKL